MSSKKLTRTSTQCDIIGKPCELPISDLPTYRQVLQKCVLFKIESIDQNPSVPQIVGHVARELTKLWQLINPNLPLVTNVFRKIKSYYEEYSNVKRKRVSKVKEQNFLEKLDKLFDICLCHCPFIDHSNVCEENCNTIHVDCKCPKDKKIPKIELPFIKDQREKVGAFGKYQIASVDMKFEKKRKRTDSKHKPQSKINITSASSSFNIPEQPEFVNPVSSSSSSEESEIHYLQKNMQELTNLARECDRYGISDRSAAGMSLSIN